MFKVHWSIFRIAVVGVLFSLLLSTAYSAAAREVINFNADWRFLKGEQPEAARQLDYDDSDWETVRVPHDWAISGPFDEAQNGYAGKLPWQGVGWYRKTFTLDEADQGQRVYFDFDGVMAFPKVYINGQLAGEWDYGYMSFRVDATRFVKFGEPNVIAVSADTRNHGTRWYPGAGIYRKVSMTLCDPVHVSNWGVYVTTPEVTNIAAKVVIQTSVEVHRKSVANVTATTTLFNPKGIAVSSATESGIETTTTLLVPLPELWDVDHPNLYVAETVIKIEGEVVDRVTTPFGIRTFEFTANDGFYLNGRRVQMNGVNLHHDQGPLGAAFNVRAMERQLEIMKEMGCNTLRTSHNPPAPEVLELCDRMGILVWDEAFDKWDDKADRVNGQPPLEEYGEKQIRNLVMRDRNHPSIVVWSIGNEIPNGGEGKSAERVTYMSEFVRKYDKTRPVGLGCHIPETTAQPILDALDLTGWNYARRYALYRERYPENPIIYSESASALSTRGFYEIPLPEDKIDYSEDIAVSSYDLNAAAWSDIADAEFKLMEDDQFVAGEMVWTGFDYLGEPTPFSQQARSSYFGIVDLVGIPKDRYFLYRSYWRPEVTTVHILPHWNWPERVGENVPVFVYTNGDSAELFLNGESLGRRTKGVIPERPADLIEGKSLTVSSAQSGNPAAMAIDGDQRTLWRAAAAGAGQWLQVDLGESKDIGYLVIEFEREAKNYGYDVKASTDGSDWFTIASKAPSNMPRWGGPTEAFHELQAYARYLRIEFNSLRSGVLASIRNFSAFIERVESSYYDVTYNYRLRWNHVEYAPGELKAVAYKDGEKIGEAVMRTAGEPAKIRLTPDRTKLNATGEDLSYILVEALDEDGNLCPLAENLINFEVTGPADIAGVGNGNPLSYEPFQASYRKLFYGKAMLIVRTMEGKTGSIQVKASSKGLANTSVALNAE